MNTIVLNLFNKLMEEKMKRAQFDYIELSVIEVKTEKQEVIFHKLEGKLESYQEICNLLNEVLA